MTAAFFVSSVVLLFALFLRTSWKFRMALRNTQSDFVSLNHDRIRSNIRFDARRLDD